MSFLLYADASGVPREKEFSGPIIIGSAPASPGAAGLDALTLPPAASLEPRHALIMRAQTTKMPVLIDLSGHDTRVNQRPVVELKVLRHADRITLGQTRLTFWEIRIMRLTPQSPYVHYICALCKKPLALGDEIIVCPYYPAVLHRICWFATPTCPDGTCEYRNHAVVMDTLSTWSAASPPGDLPPGRMRTTVRFERELEEQSDLIKRRMTCSAGNAYDQVPFRPQASVVYCPSPACNTPYHLQCWLGLPACVRCGHDIQALLNQVFQGGSAMESNTTTR